ncbi:MAG: sensor histidine kinase, partial [Rhizomicrobium sp.]
MTAEVVARNACERQRFAGPVDALYSSGRHFLSLPFALAGVAATTLAGSRLSLLSLAPLFLQLAAAISITQLAAAYRQRPADGDPSLWARRYTTLSALGGAAWGLGAALWFAWNSFPAEACLALAYLGMAATEFATRSIHPPAYGARTVLALAPLVVLFLVKGGGFPIASALVLAFFAAISIGCAARQCPGQELLFLRRHEGPASEAGTEPSALARSAFVANISHELRTPLNALLGMAQLLERADLPKQQAEHVKVMLEAGRGLQTLLDDVIALTRDDQDALADEDCDPLVIARAVTRLLQARAWEKGLRLSLTAPLDLPRVAADPKRLRQALLKYTDNALKFTERGLVDIRLEPDESKAGRPMVRFAVSDTGSGVAPDVAPLLFKPFSPGDSSYARKAQGAGLGLAVAKRIVAQAGGDVGFESDRGQGALFWFTLPVSGQIAAASPQDPIPETRALPPHG